MNQKHFLQTTTRQIRAKVFQKFSYNPKYQYFKFIIPAKSFPIGKLFSNNS